MKTPHKHAELIKAWADGAEIEVRDSLVWQETTTPTWRGYFEYRIKPEPKPDTVRYGISMNLWGRSVFAIGDNIKLTFDGETNQLKSAEVIS